LRPTASFAAQEFEISVGVMVLVDVNPDGSVKGDRVVHSEILNGDVRFLREAKLSRCRPKPVNRRAAEGIYFFFVPIANY
jgi:hypothetical protein